MNMFPVKFPYTERCSRISGVFLTTYLDEDAQDLHDSYMQEYNSERPNVFSTLQRQVPAKSINNEQRTEVSTSLGILQPCFAMHETLYYYYCKKCNNIPDASGSVSNEDCQCVRYFTVYDAYKKAMIDTNYATTTDNQGFSVLHWVCFEDWALLVELLLEAGADIDATKLYGKRYLYRPINAALDAYPGNLNVVLFLMQEGCKFYERTFASLFRHIDARCIRDGCYVARGTIQLAPKCSSQNDIMAIMREVIYREVRLNNVLIFRYSQPLTWAIARNDLDLVTMFITQANVTVNSHEGCQSLVLAWYKGCGEMVRLLLASGARVDTDFWYCLDGLARKAKPENIPACTTIATRIASHGLKVPLQLTPDDVNVIMTGLENIPATKLLLDSIASPPLLSAQCVVAVRRAIGQSRNMATDVDRLTVPVGLKEGTYQLPLPHIMRTQLLLN